MTASMPESIFKESYWLGMRWDTLNLFGTVSSLSLSEYSLLPGFCACDLTLFTLGSGEAFLEDTYGDAIGQGLVWNPLEYNASPPHLFPNTHAAVFEAIRILSQVTGRPEIWFSHFTRTWPFVTYEKPVTDSPASLKPTFKA